MTILPSLREFLTVVRRVTTDGVGVTVTDGVAENFQCAIAPPPTNAPEPDASPRESNPGTVRYADGVRGPAGGPLNAGDRVQTATGALWEVLKPSAALRQPRRVLGWDAVVLPVSVLYPWVGEAQAQGGDVIESLPLAMWTPSEDHEDTGNIETVNAEAPPEFYGMLSTANRWIELAGQRHHVVECTLDPTSPRTVLVLRRVDG